jgi:hypothetical protein
MRFYSVFTINPPMHRMNDVPVDEVHKQCACFNRVKHICIVFVNILCAIVLWINQVYWCMIIVHVLHIVTACRGVDRPIVYRSSHMHVL